MTKRIAALCAVVAALVVFAVPASAADGVRIRKVDTGSFPTVKINVIVNGKTPDLGAFTVRENGELVKNVKVSPVGQTQSPVGIVLVIDTSGSMNKNGAIDQARAAAKQFVAQKQPNDQIAIVAFNDAPRTVTNGFTSDAGQLNAAIDGLVARGETALWDAVRVGLGLFSDRSDLLPNVVVLSDGKDTVSKSTFDQAKGSALSSKAAVFSVGLKGGDFDAGPIRSLAEATGGQYLETADPKALSAAYAQVQQAIQNQYEITYTSKATDTIDLDVGVNGETASLKSIPSGGRGVVSPPKIVDTGKVPGFLKAGYTTWLIAFLVIVAAALFVYAVILLFVRDRTVERVLRPYDAESPSTLDDEGGMLIDSPLYERAVQATAKLARERGVLQRVEEMLDRADLPLQASEALFFYLIALVVLTALGAIFGGIFGVIVVGGLTALVPPAFLVAKAQLRERKFTSQLPDTLSLLAGTLRAGYSLLQGVEAVAQEVEDPMGKELRRVLAEARLGRPLEEALEDAAERMKSPDFEWAVMAIRIQREVGGNLAELLDTVADTMLQRERLRREIRALTAEGRISAIILGLLPVGLGLVMWGMNKEYMRPLFHDGLGQALLIGSAILAVVGFYWMKKTIEIEV